MEEDEERRKPGGAALSIILVRAVLPAVGARGQKVAVAVQKNLSVRSLQTTAIVRGKIVDRGERVLQYLSTWRNALRGSRVYGTSLLPSKCSDQVRTRMAMLLLQLIRTVPTASLS